ncbi:hypothetical protein BJF79_25475 [Actinomadura sp. CNU-125]|uniref:TNT domain-containing protein n=1 Tax=Actinomadura sp. CNU-125 TaxID=1904961 RepID=UPI00095D70A7|nr:TNT domain-containing protein [Actinomadura sp. CNU-125]OLT10825.1 hypothetical protein BJF79_25475 [Actinomadura sp. CNU-125]
MERSEEDRYLQDIATLLVHLTPGAWEKVSLVYGAIGTSFERALLRGTLANRRFLKKDASTTAGAFLSAEKLLPESGIYPLLRQLRTGMFEEGRGTWIYIHLDVHCSRTNNPEEFLWGVTYKYFDEYPQFEDGKWMQGVPASAFAEELRLFPRPLRHVPGWAARLAEVNATAEGFDPVEVAHAPQDETRLAAALPPGLDALFDRTRATLTALAPGHEDRFQVGRLVEGCWSVLHHPPAWIATRYQDGRCVHLRAFADPRDAVRHAAAEVIADAGAAVDAAVLRAAGIVARTTERRGDIDAWALSSKGGQLTKWARGEVRPTGADADRRRYVDLQKMHGRPGGYFVLPAGPPPEKGEFLSTHEVFAHYLDETLPKAQVAAPEPEEPAREILPVGMELDAHGGTERPFLFAIGTPFPQRGLYGTPDAYAYRVYRVVKEIEAYPGLFADAPIFPTGRPEPVPDGEGRGFYLVHSIDDLVRSGHLVRIAEPGGEPITETETGT